MEWLTKVKQYVAVFVAIATSVKELVQLFEVPKHGEEKKDAVKQGVKILVELADDFFAWIPEDKVLKVTDTMIELWVKFNNVINNWTKPSADDVVGNS